MLDQVIFEFCWKGIKVSAYTDLYAYDPEDSSLLFISLAGTEQAVKAISSAIVGCQTVSISREGNTEILVHGHPASRCRVLSTKLPSGAVHQLVADTRFFSNDNGREQLVVIPPNEDLPKVVYSQVLTHLTSPLLPEWDTWICGQLKDRDQMREMEGTLRVVAISADEATVDQIISEGVRMRRISLDSTGGTYAGIH